MSKTYTYTTTEFTYYEADSNSQKLYPKTTSVYKAGCYGPPESNPLHYYATKIIFPELQNATFDPRKISAIKFTVSRDPDATATISDFMWSILTQSYTSVMNLATVDNNMFNDSNWAGTTVTKSAISLFDTDANKTTQFNYLKNYGLCLSSKANPNIDNYHRYIQVMSASLSITVEEFDVSLYYNKNISSTVSNLPATYTSTIAEPANYTVSTLRPITNGNVFYKWYLNSSGTGTSYAPGSTIPSVFSDVTLYAAWCKEYTVSYKDPNTSQTYINPDHTTVTELTPSTNYVSITTLSSSNISRQGYELLGWKDINNNTYALNSAYIFTADTTLYPIWKSKPIIECCINNSEFSQANLKICASSNGELAWYPATIKVYDGTKWRDTI